MRRAPSRSPRALGFGFLSLTLTLTLSLSLLAPGPAEAEGRAGHCKRPFTAASAFQSSASPDLYNAALWLGGTAALRFGVDSESRWSDTNGFDREVRSGLRLDSTAARERADTASDVLLGVSAGLMPLLAIGTTLRDGECEEAYDMATDAVESLALTLFVTEAAKVIAGRDRPYVRECDGTPPSDAECNDSDRKKSFFSGHASVAAAGAGLSCSYALRNRVWGESAWGQALPCAFGVGAALTTGILRSMSDRHWGTDIWVGWAVGATVGYFDTWGPFDLLRFDTEPERADSGVSGIVLPYAGSGQLGARISLVF